MQCRRRRRADAFLSRGKFAPRPDSGNRPVSFANDRRGPPYLPVGNTRRYSESLSCIIRLTLSIRSAPSDQLLATGFGHRRLMQAFLDQRRYS